MSMIGVLRAFDDEGFDLDDLVDHDLDGARSFVAALDVDKMWQALSILTTPSHDPLRSIEDPDPLVRIQAAGGILAALAHQG